MTKREQRNRLRKQPKMRRIQASKAVNLPRVEAPPTAKKRKQRRRTRNLRGGLNLVKRFVFNARWLSLGLMALIIYAVYLIAESEQYYLTYIPVEGALTVPPEEIVSASDLAGRHIFSANPASAAEAITTIPGIISSTVTLEWPNQVYIQVGEEAPVAVWHEGGVDYWITKNGRLVPARTPTAGMVRIIAEFDNNTILESTKPVESEVEFDENGNPIEPAPTPIPRPTATAVPTPKPKNDKSEELPTSLAFIPKDVLEGALQLNLMVPEITELYYRPYGGLSYQDGRGWRVYFGTGTDMHQKLAVYKTIETNLLNKGVQPEYVNVSNQETPYYKAFGY